MLTKYYFLSIAYLLSLSLYSVEYPFEKSILFMHSENKIYQTIPKDIFSFISNLWIQITIAKDLSQRKKALRYFHTLINIEDQEKQARYQHLFNMIYEYDKEKVYEIAKMLLYVDPTDKSDDEAYQALRRGNFLTPIESFQKTAEEQNLLKYLKIFQSLPVQNTLSCDDNYFTSYDLDLELQEDQEEYERQLYIRGILAQSSEDFDVGTLIVNTENEKLKKYIHRPSFVGTLSPIIYHLIMRTTFYFSDIRLLLPFAISKCSLNKEESLLTLLLNKFINICKAQENFPQKRFMFLYILLFHANRDKNDIIIHYLPDLLDENIEEHFPDEQEPFFDGDNEAISEPYEPTVLHYACKFVLFDVLDFILEQPTINNILNKQNKKGETPLMLLCKNYLYIDDANCGYRNTSHQINVLLKYTAQLANKGTDLSIHNNEGKTLLHYLFASIHMHNDAKDIFNNLFTLCDLIEKQKPGLIFQTDFTEKTPFDIFKNSCFTKKLSDTNIQKVTDYFYLKKLTNYSNTKKYIPLSLPPTNVATALPSKSQNLIPTKSISNDKKEQSCSFQKIEINLVSKSPLPINTPSPRKQIDSTPEIPKLQSDLLTYIRNFMTNIWHNFVKTFNNFIFWYMLKDRG